MATHVRALAAAAVLASLHCVASGAAAAPAVATDAKRALSGDASGWSAIVIERASRVASDIRDPYRRAETFASIARAQAAIGDAAATEKAIRRALDAARQVPQPEFRSWVLQDIVLAQLAADDLSGARQIAERLEAERPQGAALAAVAEVQLRKGDLEAARITASRIHEEASRGLVLRQITAIEAARGQIDAANATAKNIDDVYYRALAAGDVAVAEVRAGHLDRALAQAARARRTYRGAVYGRVALAQLERGDPDGAMKTLRKIDAASQRAQAQARIAAVRAAAGDRGVAQNLFADALKSIEAVDEDRERRPALLAEVGRLQASSGDASAAGLTLQQAFTEAAMLPAGEPRDHALDSISRGQARIGELDAAIDTAKLVGEPVTRALLIRDAVSMQGDAASATAVTARSRSFNDPLAETAALFGVLGAQLTRPGHPSAHETIAAACAAVRTIEDVEFRPAAFAALAATSVTAGDLPGGRSIFAEAMSTADSIERLDRRAAAYVRIINALNDRLVFLGQPMKKAGDDPVRAP